MVGIEDEEPTQAQIDQMRELLNKHIQDNGASSFDPRDVTRFLKDDKYVKRFYMHVFELDGSQVDNAMSMVYNTFKWRKEMGIADLTSNDLNNNLKEKGTLFMHNVDKWDKRLLVFDVKKHVKGKEKMEDMKKFFLYFVERVEKETNGDKLSLVFDCAGCGLKNMDLEFIQFMINIFKEYSPYILNYILVFEMPWVLNAGWKIIKGWLPASGVKKIKFLNKNTMGEYVADDRRFLSWGGNDDWEYVFEPEQPNHPMEQNRFQSVQDFQPLQSSQVEMSNGQIDRKVQFSSVKSSGSPPSEASFNSSVSRTSSFMESGAQLLSLQPSEEVVFNPGAQGDLVAQIKVVNISGKNIVFKLKTTSPDKYRVRPSMSLLSPTGSSLIEIHVPTGTSQPAQLVRDKFLITAVVVEENSMNTQQMAELMKKTKPEAQYRMRCVLSASSSEAKQVTNVGGAAPGDNKQVDILLKKVNSMVQTQSEIREEMSLFKNLFFALIGLNVLLLLVLFWRTYNMEAICPSLPDIPSVMDKSDL